MNRNIEEMKELAEGDRIRCIVRSHFHYKAGPEETVETIYEGWNGFIDEPMVDYEEDLDNYVQVIAWEKISD